MNDVSLALLQYTPDVAQVGAGTFVMNVTASLSLFRGAHALCQRVCLTLQRLILGAQVSMAPTATGAVLLASHTQGRRRRVLTLPSLVRRLDALPCACLPQAIPYLDWLDGIGCTTLGRVRRLPRAGLRQRTEDALAQALDAAYGLVPEHFRWVRAPLAFSGRAEPAQHIEHAHALLFVAQRLVEQLCGWLAAHRQAATQAKLVLAHEQGVQAIAPTVIVISLRLPAWHPEHFLLVLAEHLHSLELAAPVVAVTLDATHIQGMAPATLELFPDPGSQPAHRQRLIERLAARLGRANLRQPDPIADHRPEIANQWVPIDQATPATMHVTGAERPFWLLAQPQALPTKGLRPFYRSPLTIVSGPERIEDGWWSGMVARDYFVARSPEGVRYWIFRERGNSGDKDSGVDGNSKDNKGGESNDNGANRGNNSSGWFLHGLFG